LQIWPKIEEDDSQAEEAKSMPVNTSPWQTEHPWEPSPDAHPQPVPLMSEADLINPLLRLSDVIDEQAVLCQAAMPLVEALRLLKHSATGAVPMVDHGRPVGFLSDRGAIAAIYDRPGDWERLTAGELAESAVTARAGDTLDVIFKRFHRGGLFVVDSRGDLQGVVTLRSLAGGITERGWGWLFATRLFPVA
jgi:CBS domain-containing protein